MRRKGFTLVELLVVIAIIALLMGILMPALAQVRRLAQRMMCGTNLKGLGNAIYTYVQDNDEAFPRAGGRRSVWDDQIDDWEAESETEAFGRAPGAGATIGSCWYLLIKYADVTPKQFICKGDVGAKEFKLSDYDYDEEVILDITDPWDFGDHTEDALAPGIHYSYSYHHPFHWDGGTKNFPLDASSNPAAPVAADRNLYIDRNAETYRTETANPDEDQPEWNRGYYDPDRTGNAAAHQRDGQNVLFVDAHSNFEKYPNCGIMNDNIYQYWPSEPPPQPDPEEMQVDGEIITTAQIGGTAVGPEAYEDAFLISERNW